MITLKNYKDHKPKRISFEGVNWQDDLELLDEIIRDETPEDKAAAIMAKYADREFDLQVSDLAWIRAIAGLTQAQAAERLGISKSHYAGIEAGSYTGDKVMLNVGKLLDEDQINRAISVLQFIRFIKNI